MPTEEELTNLNRLIEESQKKALAKSLERVKAKPSLKPLEIKESIISERERTEEVPIGTHFHLTYVDVAILIVGVFFFTTIFWLPIWQGVGLFLAIGLISTLIIRNVYIQLISIAFSVVYLILSLLAGIFLDSLDIFVIIFGFNSITLIPIILSAAIFVSVLGLGIFYGMKPSRKVIVAYVPVVAFILSILDAIIALILLGTFPNYFAVIHTFFIYTFIHFTIYLVAYLITYALMAGDTWLVIYLLKKINEEPAYYPPLGR